MTTTFRRVDTSAKPAKAPPAPQPVVTLWVPPASRAEAEACLFDFLRALRQGRAQVSRPLLLEPATLRTVYAAPNPILVEALRHCLDSFLVELSPDPAQWGPLEVSPALLGFALAIYTCLTPPLARTAQERDPLPEFGAALIETLPPARSLAEILACHALLAGPAEALPLLFPDRAALLEGLLLRSPLTAVYHPHLYTPPPLTPLAAELLRGWRHHSAPLAPWRDPDDWLAALAPALTNRPIAAYLRRRWLALPETRPACRNLGLLLEALRRRGERAFVLGFYETYDRFAAQTVEDPWRGRPMRRWPILDTIEQLLCAEGDSEAAVGLNRWGNEYFLKFHALIQTVIAEDGVPADFNLLTPGLILTLRPLLAWTTEEGRGPRLDLGVIQFEDGEDV